MINNDKTIFLLERIANALDRLAPPEKKIDNLDASEGFVFDSNSGLIRPIEGINRIPITLLQGIEPQKIWAKTRRPCLQVYRVICKINA